jgi:arginyl-tRNA synthetase
LESVETHLAARIREAVAEVIGEPWSGTVPVEVSNRPDLGDYASAVAFAVAKARGQPPLELARRIAAVLAGRPDELIARAEATPPAFLNLRLADAFLAEVVAEAHRSAGAIADQSIGAGTKIVLEHTNVNPNKAAHVGHLRNACLGDSLARILRRLGYAVEAQNYIDDTGVQVADVVVGLRVLGLNGLEEETAFDRRCSAVYAAVQRAYEADPGLVAHRAAVQQAIEHGQGELADFAHEVASRVAAANLATMARVGISYDLLTWESDLLRLGFWAAAFGQLQAAGAVRLETAGPQAGCWVMPFGLGTVEAGGKVVTEDKVLVTGQGVATYTAKDIAYQLWKFGLLERDFGYRRWGRQADGRLLWTSTHGDGEPDAPRFAHADRVINVVDMTQAYPQQVVYEALRRMGHPGAADHSEHLAYAVVTLSPAAARELGLAVGEEAAAVAMSGRQGIQVWADDLLDRLEARLGERTAPAVAAAIAAGAARYYLLKFSNQQPIAFDFEDALRTTGETGVYLQYAFVRAGGILRRLEEGAATAGPAAAPQPLAAPDRRLVLKMAEYPRVLATAGSERTVSVLAKHAFELATAFSTFYDNTPPIVSEADPSLRAWRAGLVAAARLVLGDALDLLGIPRLEHI